MPSSPSVLIGDPGFVLIVFEMGFQPPREATFAGGHLPGNGSKRGDQLCHVAAIIEREDSPAAMNQYDRTLVLRFPARQPSLF